MSLNENSLFDILLDVCDGVFCLENELIAAAKNGLELPQLDIKRTKTGGVLDVSITVSPIYDV
jgi:hypothetical protein